MFGPLLFSGGETSFVLGVVVMRAWIAATVFALPLATAPADVDRSGGRKYSQADLLRNYALARCLSRAFPDSQLAPDASATAAGYLERGSVSADAYAEIAKLAEEFLARKYSSLSGQPLQTMKCIDLFHSSDVDRVVRRFAPRR